MLICALSLLLLPTNWIVDAAAGPGTNFTDLPAAIAAAADGDTIFVRAGSYTGFVLSGKALTIRGAGVAATAIGDAGPGQGCTVSGTPAGSVTVLSGLTFHGTRSGLSVEDTHVVLLHCRLDGAPAGFFAVYHGLELGILQAEVEASDCDLFGGDNPGGTAGDAVRVRNGTFAADHCALTGGRSFPGTVSTFGGNGLQIQNGRARLDRCACTGGDVAQGAGGFGVYSSFPGGVARVCGDVSTIVSGGRNIGNVRSQGLVSLSGTTIGVESHGPITVVGGTLGSVALGLPELPRLSVVGGTLPSGDTDAAQLVTVTVDSALPLEPMLFVIGILPLFQPAVPPLLGDLLIDLNITSVVPGVLDAAGQFQFAFLPAAVFGGGAPFPVYAQVGVLDSVAGELRLSNLDARFYSL